MAIIHNIVLRTLNAIYLQAPFVMNADKRDFVGYAMIWWEFIESEYCSRAMGGARNGEVGIGSYEC
jgi:hypothetical protein